MIWKKLPYWLKGGLIGIVVGILSFFLIIGQLASLAFLKVLCGVKSDGIIYAKGLFGSCNFLQNPLLYQLFIYGELIIFGFIIGTLIGFIIGKIKNKQPQNKHDKKNR